uniref:Uncharacterized protein n=1 Tax=Anguilla anguilla TaxID=7936 RepID=A0A0E9UM21_ANGAN
MRSRNRGKRKKKNFFSLFCTVWMHLSCVRRGMWIRS